MRVFALGDIHLSHQVEKPMDVFGGHWQNHTERTAKNWLETVSEDDVVIMPGDFSWATYLGQAEEDFMFLDKLPGKKILLKGNHDYWWETLTKMRGFLEKIGVSNIDFLYNNSHCIGDMCFCGTKGWDYGVEKDPKIINREVSRFQMSIDSIGESKKEVVAVFHYPPYANPELLDIMQKHDISKCIYGHVHGSTNDEEKYLRDGILYINASADQVGFRPSEI